MKKLAILLAALLVISCSDDKPILGPEAEEQEQIFKVENTPYQQFVIDNLKGKLLYSYYNNRLFSKPEVEERGEGKYVGVRVVEYWICSEPSDEELLEDASIDLTYQFGRYLTNVNADIIRYIDIGGQVVWESNGWIRLLGPNEFVFRYFVRRYWDREKDVYVTVSEIGDLAVTNFLYTKHDNQISLGPFTGNKTLYDITSVDKLSAVLSGALDVELNGG